MASSLDSPNLNPKLRETWLWKLFYLSSKSSRSWSWSRNRKWRRCRLSSTQWRQKCKTICLKMKSWANRFEMTKTFNLPNQFTVVQPVRPWTECTKLRELYHSLNYQITNQIKLNLCNSKLSLCSIRSNNTLQRNCKGSFSTFLPQIRQQIKQCMRNKRTQLKKHTDIS